MIMDVAFDREGITNIWHKTIYICCHICSVIEIHHFILPLFLVMLVKNNSYYSFLFFLCNSLT